MCRNLMKNVSNHHTRGPQMMYRYTYIIMMMMMIMMFTYCICLYLTILNPTHNS